MATFVVLKVPSNNFVATLGFFFKISPHINIWANYENDESGKQNVDKFKFINTVPKLSKANETRLSKVF